MRLPLCLRLASAQACQAFVTSVDKSNLLDAVDCSSAELRKLVDLGGSLLITLMHQAHSAEATIEDIACEPDSCISQQAKAAVHAHAEYTILAAHIVLAHLGPVVHLCTACSRVLMITCCSLPRIESMEACRVDTFSSMASHSGMPASIGPAKSASQPLTRAAPCVITRSRRS